MFAKVSSGLLHHSCLLVRDGQSEYGDEGVPAVVVADRILFLSHSRSDIEDSHVRWMAFWRENDGYE